MGNHGVAGLKGADRSVAAATVDGVSWFKASLATHPRRRIIEAHEAIHRSQYAARSTGQPTGNREELEAEAEAHAERVARGCTFAPTLAPPAGMVLAAPDQVATAEGARLVPGDGGYLYRQLADGTITILAGPTGAGATLPPGHRHNVAITKEIGPHPRANGAAPAMGNENAAADDVVRLGKGRFARFTVILGTNKVSREQQLGGEVFVDISEGRVDLTLRMKLALQEKIPFGEAALNPSGRIDVSVTYRPALKRVDAAKVVLSMEQSEEQEVGSVTMALKFVGAVQGRLQPPNKIHFKAVGDARFTLEATGTSSKLSVVQKLIRCDLGGGVLTLGPVFPDLPQHLPRTAQEIMAAVARLIRSIEPSLEWHPRLSCEQALLDTKRKANAPRSLVPKEWGLPSEGSPLPGDIPSGWPFGSTF